MEVIIPVGAIIAGWTVRIRFGAIRVDTHDITVEMGILLSVSVVYA